ncbi:MULTISPECIES: helix-turn-helix domain-containing protein [Vibrio]|uniref:HTH Mu-type domain-containing protein n=3 Tax=Vibrionaceae TaxID=641 RepID=A0A0H3ZMC9_9GAMM|nr:S24 family peptidase [Vibrio sonorensis]AKN37423.1 hypothetical protein [Enterovibrio norvegicus]AKN37769.1 Phage repressor [Vibrio sp. FF_482]
MKEWFRGVELIEIDGMPNTRQGINTNAHRNNWLKRKAMGRGSAVEYHISNFHEDVQKLLIEKYGTEQDLRNAKEVIERLRVNGLELARQQPEPSNVSKIVPLSDYEDWARLPVYDVHAAAGAGTLVQSEFQIGVFSIPVALLHEYGLKESYCSVIFVDGNSMHPTVSDKDRVLVDIRETPHPAKDGVYVIRIDDAVYIKRLNWNIAKGIYNVISDNPKHESFEINHNNGRNFKIIGKVVTTVMKAVI